jgi:hypothetical protein
MTIFIITYATPNGTKQIYYRAETLDKEIALSRWRKDTSNFFCTAQIEKLEKIPQHLLD